MIVGTGWPAVASCPQPDRLPEVVVRVNEGELRLDHSLDAEGIGAVRSAVVAGPAGTPPPSWRTVGLTVAEFRVQTALRGTYRRPPGSRAGGCAELSLVEVTIGYAEQVVYVPRTYLPGSCTFEAVLDHENLHVLDNLEVLREFAARYEAEARAAVKAVAVLPVRSQAEAQRQPLDHLEAALAPVSQAFQAAQSARAMVRDTPDEYRAVMARCSQW